MWKGWTMLTDWMRRADYTDPDSFGMYIYDFHWYGLIELIENLVRQSTSLAFPLPFHFAFAKAFNSSPTSRKPAPHTPKS
jgi:hypothetical protein